LRSPVQYWDWFFVLSAFAPVSFLRGQRCLLVLLALLSFFLPNQKIHRAARWKGPLLLLFVASGALFESLLLNSRARLLQYRYSAENHSFERRDSVIYS